MKSQNTYFSSKSRSWRLSDLPTDSSHWSEWVSVHISAWKEAFVAGQKHNMSRSEPLFMNTALHFHCVGGIRANCRHQTHCNCCPRPSHSDVWSRQAPVGHIFQTNGLCFTEKRWWFSSSSSSGWGWLAGVHWSGGWKSFLSSQSQWASR